MKCVGFQRLKLDSENNVVFEETIDNFGRTKDFKPEEKGFSKKVDVKIIFQRKAYSEQDLLLITGYFKQTITLSIPEQRNTKYCYFYYEPKCMNTVCLRNFDGDYTYTVSLRQKRETEERLYDTEYSEATRITEQEARQLLIDRKAMALFDSEALTDMCVQFVKLG